MENHEHDTAQCLKLFEQLSEYLDNELDAATCQDVERHIEGCMKCQTCLETLRRTIEICRQSEPKPVPEMFSRRLRDLIESMQGEQTP